jgi:sulfopyruvate decarboxylase TPP-binding subunit
MQNSGFGHSVNAIASLLIPYRIPAILLVSWRGESNDDSPEHEVMGKAFSELVRSVGLQTVSIKDEGIADAVRSSFILSQRERAPCVILARKNEL